MITIVTAFLVIIILGEIVLSIYERWWLMELKAEIEKTFKQIDELQTLLSIKKQRIVRLESELQRLMDVVCEEDAEIIGRLLDNKRIER